MYRWAWRSTSSKRVFHEWDGYSTKQGFPWRGVWGVMKWPWVGLQVSDIHQYRILHFSIKQSYAYEHNPSLLSLQLRCHWASSDTSGTKVESQTIIRKSTIYSAPRIPIQSLCNLTRSFVALCGFIFATFGTITMNNMLVLLKQQGWCVNSNLLDFMEMEHNSQVLWTISSSLRYWTSLYSLHDITTICFVRHWHSRTYFGRISKYLY